jgi:hypothetical protein
VNALVEDLQSAIDHAMGYGTPHEYYMKLGQRSVVTDLREWMIGNVDRGSVDAGNLSAYLMAMWIIADGQTGTVTDGES